MTTDVSTNKLKINVLTRTQYDSSEKNNDELYFVEESETNTWLIAVTDVAPSTASINDRYYNSNTKLIYTWNGSSWTNSISPTADDLYIDKSDNSTYAWDGTNLIQIGSSGGITTDDIDGQTITLNSSDKIQAAGVINKNDGAAKYDWVGTKQEYDELEEIHNDWIYYITDDEYASGNMSMSNVYNRLNRAYAWTYRHVNGAGNVYNIYYNNATYKSTDAFSATEVIGPGYWEWSSNYIICDGKLYYITVSGNNVTRTQIGTDTTWSAISGSNSINYTLAINNGDLYLISSGTPTLKDSSGWQKISFYYSSSSYKTLGIKNDSLYMLTNNGNTITLLDSSGIWSQITGISGNANEYMFGIKDGKLYSISYSGVITEISSDNTWNYICGYDVYLEQKNRYALGINGSKLYILKGDEIILANDTETWIKCCGYGYGSNCSFALTSTGKLYNIERSYYSGDIELTQIGTDTTWSDISGYGAQSIGINNGNVYINLGSPTQLSTSGGITKVYGSPYSSTTACCSAYWTGSVTEDVHTVYTVPSPQTGFHTYADENLTNVSTITAVNMNNNTITDGLYTYTRDSAADKVFTSVSPDSKNQLVSMADLLNAIKG